MVAEKSAVSISKQITYTSNNLNFTSPNKYDILSEICIDCNNAICKCNRNNVIIC